MASSIPLTSYHEHYSANKHKFSQNSTNKRTNTLNHQSFGGILAGNQSLDNSMSYINYLHILPRKQLVRHQKVIHKFKAM